MKEQSKLGLGDELANNNVQHEIHFDANDENIEIVPDVVQCCYSHTGCCNPALNNTTQDTHHQPTTSYLLQSYLRHISHYGLNNRMSAIYLQIDMYTSSRLLPRKYYLLQNIRFLSM